ncbi:hypothetical protein TNCV_1725341 [Trichonephila clavipes]|nr:hypothetical protein TNCV_1725341 [Trichonephila clavipes]
MVWRLGRPMHWTSTANLSFTTCCIQVIPNRNTEMCGGSILLEPHGNRLGKGAGSTAIGKHFNSGESTVRAIKKNEAAIRKSVISGTKLSTKFASYIRDVLLERTERAIAMWIEEQVQRRIPISGYF